MYFHDFGERFELHELFTRHGVELILLPNMEVLRATGGYPGMIDALFLNPTRHFPVNAMAQRGWRGLVTQRVIKNIRDIFCLESLAGGFAGRILARAPRTPGRDELVWDSEMMAKLLEAWNDAQFACQFASDILRNAGGMAGFLRAFNQRYIPRRDRIVSHFSNLLAPVLAYYVQKEDAARHQRELTGDLVL